MEAISILIADDHKLIRDTWSFILNTDDRFKVVAECGNGEEAIEQAKQKRPQIVLMDINMSPISGLEATRQIRKVSPGSKIIGVSKGVNSNFCGVFSINSRSRGGDVFSLRPWLAPRRWR